eukprot:4768351-Pyramimonas_sp.AAC.1
MHQPATNTHRNRRRMRLANQVAGGWVGCLSEQRSGQFSANNNLLYHVYCTAHVASRRLHRVNRTTYIAPHRLHRVCCITSVISHTVHHIYCTA